MAGLVTIKRYYDLPEALAAKAFLDSHGLMPFLPDEHFVTASWMHLFALGGFRLQVVESEAAQAIELVAKTAPPLAVSWNTMSHRTMGLVSPVLAEWVWVNSSFTQ